MSPLYLTYLNALDVAAMALSDDEILAAVEQGLAAQGRGETVIEPRVHLVPDKSVPGHFNVLRGAFRAPINLAGVKVIGDYVDNYKQGLPSELGLLLLMDPATGAPKAIIDGSHLTDMRTGAVTAIGAKHLARRASKFSGTWARAARPIGMYACSTGCSTSTRSGCTRAGPRAGTPSPPVSRPISASR